MSNYIKYDKLELNYLSNKDPVLKKYIDSIGFVKRKINTNVYTSLIESIVGQQISTKAADTIRSKILTLIGNLTPENVLKTKKDDLLSCGLSNRKYEYIIGITNSFINNPEVYNNLSSKSDDEIINVLTKLKGVGIWTAKMLLIHTFLRKDILSFKDIAIKRVLMRLHNLEEITKEDEKYYKKLYSPYGTIASIYLWEISKTK